MEKVSEEKDWIGFDIPESRYAYSKPVVIREWNSGRITVKIGFVKKHPEKRNLVLEKVWIAKDGFQTSRTFNVKNIQDWQKIVTTVNRLWPELEDKFTSDDIDAAIKKLSDENQTLEIIARYPNILRNIPKSVDLLNLSEDEIKGLNLFLTTGGEIAVSVLNKLSKEPVKDVDDLNKILESYKLSTVNSLITHITSRLAFIDTFEKVIHNDKSYERKGKDSVHNLLKNNIWIVDRNYSVLHDDMTLKKIIWEQWQKQFKGKDSNKRPDLLCLTSGEKVNDTLIIVEIKRPNKVIKFEMLEQVMIYKEILQEHSGQEIRNFSAYLVGKKVDKLLNKNPFSKSGITVKTYTDFIGEVRYFYREYLEIVKKEQYVF